MKEFILIVWLTNAGALSDISFQVTVMDSAAACEEYKVYETMRQKLLFKRFEDVDVKATCLPMEVLNLMVSGQDK